MFRIGIDIGGTNIKMAVIDQNDIVYKSSFKTEDT